MSLRAEIDKIWGSGNVILEDFRRVESISARLVPLERELARRRSLPFAVPIEWPSTWHKEDYGPEMSTSIADATIVHGVSEAPHVLVTTGYGVIHVQTWSAINVLGATDHAHSLHPLSRSGLDHNKVYRVENSALLALCGSLHLPGDDFFKEQYRASHFLFVFEGAFVDCVARSVQPAGIWPTLAEARTHAQRILFPSE
jgi:hypothetical protein